MPESFLLCYYQQRSGSAHRQERLLPQINSYRRDEIKEWITAKGKQSVRGRKPRVQRDVMS
ncbi:hypothetical protein R3I93_000563 [Phoxinus phoxinus]|uniref:Uncharacterized protein n=1 Tax=Phoxinus phoxinus TaxID=58324 RepID=A0AAN9HI66_9TELE